LGNLISRPKGTLEGRRRVHNSFEKRVGCSVYMGRVGVGRAVKKGGPTKTIFKMNDNPKERETNYEKRSLERKLSREKQEEKKTSPEGRTLGPQKHKKKKHLGETKL